MFSESSRCFSIKKKAEDEQGSRNQRPTCSKDENKNRFFIDFLFFFWKGACIFSLYPLLLLTATFRVAFGLIRPGGLWRKPSGS